MTQPITTPEMAIVPPVVPPPEIAVTNLIRPARFGSPAEWWYRRITSSWLLAGKLLWRRGMLIREGFL